MATKSQALVPVKPKPGKLAVDFRRLIQKTMGATTEAIATAERVSKEEVERSIRHAEIYREQNGLEATNIAIGAVAISLTPDVEKALRSGLRAKKVSKRFRRRNGKLEEYTVISEDHDIQLKAAEQVKGLVESIQPKGSKINVNAQANAQAAAASSFSEHNYQPGIEEKIDQIRSRVEQANAGPRELATIKDDDADIIEEDGEEESAETTESLGEEGSSEEPAESGP